MSSPPSAGGSHDRDLLLEAIEESRLCPPSGSAYSVGALVATDAGVVLARGHSRETDPHDHAEEVALARLARLEPCRRPDPGTLTLYSSLEPCTQRRSRPVPCAELVVASGIRRVVVAAREPELFADGRGVEDLRAAGVDVVEIRELAGLVRAVNAHLPAWGRAWQRRRAVGDLAGRATARHPNGRSGPGHDEPIRPE